MKIPLARLIAAQTKRRTFTIRTPEPLVRDRNALLAVYLRVVRHWEDARVRVLAAYERELVRVEYRDAEIASPVGMHKGFPIPKPRSAVADAIGDLEDAIAEEGNWFTRLFVTLQAEIQAWGVSVEAWQRGKWRGAVLSATGVDLDTMLYAGDVEQTLEAVIAQNVALIRDVNEQQAARMKDAVFRGLNGRYPARDVAKELQAITGFGRKRAMLIASDQLQKATAALDTERQFQAGITQFEWVHSKKRHPRDWHVARNGKVYDLRTRKQIDGDEVIPADDMPGIPVRCGCRKLAHLDLDAMERELEERGL